MRLLKTGKGTCAGKFDSKNEANYMFIMYFYITLSVAAITVVKNESYTFISLHVICLIVYA